MVFQPPSPLTLAGRRSGDDDDEEPTSGNVTASTATNTSTPVVSVAPETTTHIVEDEDDDDDDDDDDDVVKSFDVEEDEPPEPLRKDHDISGKYDRHIFTTLYIMLVLALVGLGFAIIRYVQARMESNKNSTPFDRDTSSFKTQLQAILSDVVKSSVLFEASSPQAQAVEWMVFEDHMLTMEDVIVGAAYDDPFQVYQRFALMALFFGTSGELWEDTPWTENGMVHTCDFVGVDCDEKKQVVILDLFLRKLRGRIPDDLGLLTQLTSINLQSNLLEGSIPSFFFDKLTNLEFLDLSYNEFSSTLSPDVAKLTNLRALVLDQLTGLTGTLPESLKTMSNIQEAHFEQSLLKGPIFDFVAHWPKLETLDIRFSSFTGTIPTEIGNMENLRILNMRNSAIDATNLPSEIGLISTLKEFLVWSMTMDGGTIPTEFQNCEKLEVLSIQGSNFAGEIPTELGKLTMLQHLVLEGGSLSGPVPSELGLLTNLKWLSIALNNLTGQLPDELGNLKQLSMLEVHYNDLDGSIPRGVCNDYINIERSCTITECECCRIPCHN